MRSLLAVRAGLWQIVRCRRWPGSWWWHGAGFLYPQALIASLEQVGRWRNAQTYRFLAPAWRCPPAPLITWCTKGSIRIEAGVLKDCAWHGAEGWPLLISFEPRGYGSCLPLRIGTLGDVIWRCQRPLRQMPLSTRGTPTCSGSPSLPGKDCYGLSLCERT